MYRLLKCTKDSYITNKIINSTQTVDSRSINANTGQAGTIDLFKLYDETTVTSGSSGLELTRGLLYFDYTPLLELTASKLDYTHSSFSCRLRMFDVYGGQTTPSNFTIVCNPLAQTFDEGRGNDILAFRDLDTTNWLSASSTNAWYVSGCAASGSVGTPSIDYYNSISGSQLFARGDEDLDIDVTDIVSMSLSGQITNFGLRIAFSDALENDTNTYFVKRFASRHSNNKFKHPRIVVQYDDSMLDQQLDAWFDVSHSFGVYNSWFGQYRNFHSNSAQITGSNCVRVDLVASKSVYITTSSWSSTHSQSITYVTSSYIYSSYSFTGSQYNVGNNYITGVYKVSCSIPSADVANFLTDTSSVSYIPVWKSFDGTVLFASGSPIVFKTLNASNDNVAERNYIVNIQNLKTVYTQDEVARLRVFIQDYKTDLKAYYVPIDPTSEIHPNMHWRLLHAWTRDVIIPFDQTSNSTKLSCDGKGMYFDIYMSDLEVDQNYEIEFLTEELGQNYLILNQGFKFKVVS